ncbi:hydroxypyruvate isomerase family protein [Stutzerimonas tarimensis]|uniref:Hydroxypyruvate isomerase family protein n=1 Tax=Stutzerimonas tarimensis TaxID=1507735 RepID=A0ABV7T9W0_9GAMM
MKIAANLSLLFTELPLAERILAARVAGFDGVEIQFPYELPAIRLKELLERAGLPLALINLPAGDFMTGGAGLAAVPQRLDEFDEALEESLSYAAMVRPSSVNVLAGRLAEGVEPEQAMETLVRNLRRAASAFELLGIRLLCEAINPLDMPGFLINTPDDLLQLLDRVAHPNLAAQLDLYHMARQGLDPVGCVRRLGGKIGHVQFADCPGRGTPGSGRLDFHAARSALREVGYDGWLAAEYRPGEQGTERSLGWLEQWRQA